MKILVLSCDKYEDTFAPFHYCIEKYWPDHPEIIYTTETVINPYYKTVCKNTEWNDRTLAAVNEIDDDYILMMCDDVFIRKPVDTNRLKYLLEAAKTLDDFCCMSFISDIMPRNSLMIIPVNNYTDIGWRKYDKYSNSVNCTLWKKERLVECLSGVPISIDNFESDINRFHGKYYSSINGNWPISWGRENKKRRVALVRGKWTTECVRFFNSENYFIDFSKRGIIEGD